jgi:hypothetical protein
MKLIELIGTLFNPEKLEKLISVLGLNTKSEAFLVYMKGDLYMTADIRIFKLKNQKMKYFLKKMALNISNSSPLNIFRT